MHRFHGTGLVSTKTQNVSQTLYLPSKNACKFPLTNLSTGKELKNIDCVKMQFTKYVPIVSIVPSGSLNEKYI